jgi:flagellar hook assembly protein FlgD
VFDVGGRLVRELWAGERAAGRHELTWDGRDAAGRAVASGVYLARVSASGEERTARIVRRS